MSWVPRLSRSLPVHATRAAVDALDALAERLERYAGRPHHVAMAEVLAELAREYELAVVQARTRSEALRVARTETERRRLLEDLVHDARDRAALDRWLDAEAIEDRDRITLHRLWQQRQLLATALSDALRGGRIATVGETLADLLVELSRSALADPREPWQVRAAFAGLLGAVARRTGSPVASQELREWALASLEPVWVQVAALEAYVGVRASRNDDVGAILHAVLLPSPTAMPWLPEDHVFVRARAARLCGAHHQWALALEALSRPDPSEHVRMAAARALAQERGATHLRRWLGSDVEDPRVRGVAYLALMPDHGRPGRQDWAALVGDALGRESATVQRILVQAVLDRRPLLAELPYETLAARWGPELERLSASDDEDLADGAALLARWLHLRVDARRSAALDAVEDWLASAREGARRDFRGPPVGDLDEEALLEVLCVAAADRFDLSADPLPGGGYTLYYGIPPRFQAWRAWFELRNPAPDKRQAHPHHVDDVPPGRLLAPSRRLAEVTPTRVPGRRVATTESLAWGAALPLPAQLVAATRQARTEIVTPRHRLTLHRRSSRLTGWWRVQRRYLAVATLRDEVRERGEAGWLAYDEHVRELGIDVVRHRALPGLAEALLLAGDAVRYDTNTLGDLAVWGAVVVAGWSARQLWISRTVAAQRDRIPLVVGGWGSRGKSGTERLKAGLFHGLGYRVVAKTTGCEAMFIASVPGADPVEVFLFRPYDKATIVEQRDVLRMASDLDAQVMTWECMALRPSFVEILQRQWMRDDLSTLTNTYPDHEDIQGPSGRDVADTIARFIPHRGTCISTERHMAPVLDQEGARSGSRIVHVRPEAWELLPADLVARFPYQEHPRNIALVLTLARALQIEEDQALALMADCVVPDLGVLKEYGPAPFRDRQVSFVNGCSANERAGFLSNWNRVGLSAFSEDSGLRERLAVVFNNRADRLARQKVFARIALLDTSADAIVMIGTNVGSFAVDYQQGLDTLLRPALKTAWGAGDEAGRTRLLERVGWHLRRHPLPLDEALARATAFAPSAADRLAEVAREAWTRPLDGATLARHPHREAVAATPGETAAQWLREVAWLHALHERHDWALDQVADGLAALLASRLLPLRDPGLTGDQVLLRIAHTAPEGSRLRILGAENIKGTGLDFVYRWISLDTIQPLVARLEGAPGTHEAREALAGLQDHADYGLMEVELALAAVRAAVEGGRLRVFGLQAEAEAVLMHLDGIRERHERALAVTGGRGGLRAAVLAGLEAMLDTFDSIRRRRQADRLYRDLRARRVGIRRAAVVAKKLTSRQKGGWLRISW